VAEQLRRLQRPPRSVAGSTKKDILSACQYLLSRRGEISYFELHKLAYLAEYLHVRSTGERLTSAFFIRQKDGPYCTDLHINKLVRADPNIKVSSRGKKLFLRLGSSSAPRLINDDLNLGVDFQGTLDEVLDRYNYSNEADLKKAVYLTAPMRLMLRREKYEHINLFNAPIDFMTARQG